MILKKLDDRGAKMMLGTDTITVYSVAGFAVHQDLELAVKAGLTPYHALRSRPSRPPSTSACPKRPERLKPASEATSCCSTPIR